MNTELFREAAEGITQSKLEPRDLGSLFCKAVNETSPTCEISKPGIKF